MSSDTKRNVLLGIGVGATMATLYSLWVLGVFLLGGAEPFSDLDTTVQAVIVTYYAAGTIGGGLIGSLLPLARRFPGRILLGVLGGLVAFFCIEIATEGPFWNWSRAEWQTVAVLGTGMGAVGGAFWRKATGW